MALFSKIQSRDDALKVVNEGSGAFFAIAAIQAALSLFVGFSILIDAVIYSIGGFFLFRFRSRATATVLLILAAIAVAMTIGNAFGTAFGGGRNISLAVIVLWVAIRSVEATYKLHGKLAASGNSADAP